MQKILILAAAAMLSGCATNPTRWENRLVCTIDGSEAHVISKWFGLFSIGSQLAKADAAVACVR